MLLPPDEENQIKKSIKLEKIKEEKINIKVLGKVYKKD